MRGTGRTLTAIQLLEWQVHHRGVITYIQQHLGCFAKDFFNGVEVHTLTHDIGRVTVLGEQRIEAVGLTLRFCHYRFTITLTLLDNALRLTLSFRDNGVGVGHALVDRALTIFTGTNHVIKGVDDRLWCRGRLDVDGL